MKSIKSRRKPSGKTDDRWAKLAVDDVSDIDRDIEMLLGLLRYRRGYSQNNAKAELVRRLSFAT